LRGEEKRIGKPDEAMEMKMDETWGEGSVHIFRPLEGVWTYGAPINNMVHQ
jgi:hypothetical protein